MSSSSVTYRDLRNTPGRVYERLAEGEPLTLVADGEAKALLIPIDDGDVETVKAAWQRGRALLALQRLQAKARAEGTSRLSRTQIDAEIALARKERRATER